MFAMSSMFRQIYTIVNLSSYCAIPLCAELEEDEADCHFHSYLAHSSLAIIFPLHLLYLVGTTKHSTSALISGLQLAITKQLSPDSDSPKSRPFPTLKFLWLIVAFTFAVTLPGLLWFASISLAS
jgi:hypothetical protein